MGCGGILVERGAAVKAAHGEGSLPQQRKRLGAKCKGFEERCVGEWVGDSASERSLMSMPAVRPGNHDTTRPRTAARTAGDNLDPFATLI